MSEASKPPQEAGFINSSLCIFLLGFISFSNFLVIGGLKFV